MFCDLGIQNLVPCNAEIHEYTLVRKFVQVDFRIVGQDWRPSQASTSTYCASSCPRPSDNWAKSMLKPSSVLRENRKQWLTDGLFYRPSFIIRTSAQTASWVLKRRKTWPLGISSRTILRAVRTSNVGLSGPRVLSLCTTNVLFSILQHTIMSLETAGISCVLRAWTFTVSVMIFADDL